MVHITLRVEGLTRSVTPERLAEGEELAELLREAGHSVAVEGVERIPDSTPGRYRIVWAETVAIFIGSAAASGLVGAVMTDIYNAAKKWARDQFKKKTAAKPNGRVPTQSFTLYGSDGKPLLYWKISYEGEEETFYGEIEGKSDDQPEK